MDLQTAFYILGIGFFISGLLVLIAIVVMIFSLYRRFKTMRESIPLGFISYLQSHNSDSIKALGISLVGICLSYFKSRFHKRENT
jgi:hypothetical protein